MRIRTLSLAGSLVALFAFAGIGLLLLMHGARATGAFESGAYATRIVSEGVSGLRLVTLEYLLYRQPQAREQWLERHANLARFLQTHPFGEGAGQRILDEIRARHESAAQAFARLAALQERGGASRPAAPDAESDDARLATRIMRDTQDMVADVDRLVQLGQARLDEDLRFTNRLIFALLALLLIFLALGLALVRRRVLAPLQRLKAGTDRIREGDLAIRTYAGGDDEIAELCRAFDAMAASLAGARDDLERRTRQLEETNRELEAFSYSVSHDLRAPLRGVDGWSLALLQDYGESLDETARGYIATVRGEAQRMGRLIDDLLQLSRVGRAEMKREPVDLSALAGEIAARLKAENPSRRLEFAIEPSLTAVGDARLLEVALTNLLENAVKFTGPRPVARIEFGREAPGGASPRAYHVRDNGVGFDTEQARTLFGAFQRFHRASEFPGNGIGLATVKRIVHRHGGHIAAESAPDGGATFRFTLGEDP